MVRFPENHSKRLPTMPDEKSVSEDNFQLLLRWLDPDAESAGNKYEHIRQRLIRLFVARGCWDAEALADTTIDRVTRIAPRIIERYSGQPEIFFYGVGRKVHLEWLRKRKESCPIEFSAPEDPDRDLSGAALDCLDACLGRLETDRRELIVSYYAGEKNVKIRSRKELGLRLGISESALHIRASRIRGKLRDCVKGCLANRGA